MATALEVDTKPLLRMMEQKGKCNFADSLQAFTRQGLSASEARDTIWRLLSEGLIEFTTDRQLRLPRLMKKVAG